MEDEIRIEGAREHNLQGFDCRIPKKAITVITGPSGSGKSSLAIDTLLAEGLFRLETLAGFGSVRAQPRLRPHVRAIRGLPPVAELDGRSAADSRQTLAGFFGFGPMLFNYCMRAGVRRCLRCRQGVITRTPREEGVRRILSDCTGSTVAIAAYLTRAGGAAADEAALQHAAAQGYSLILSGGSIIDLDADPAQRARIVQQLERGGTDLAVVTDRIVAYPENEARLAEAVALAAALQHAGIAALPLDSEGSTVTAPGFLFSEEGLCGHCGAVSFPLREALFRLTLAEPSEGYHGMLPELAGINALPPLEREEFEQMLVGETPLALLLQRSFAELACQPELPELGLLAAAAGRAVRMGLGHLTPLRSVASLSLGEAQRVRLLGRFLRPLAGFFYVLDEPTIGLHPADWQRLWGVLEELVGRDNTVVLVEHNLQYAARSTHLLVLGPGAGSRGGRLLYQGPPAGYQFAPVLPPQPRATEPAGEIRVTGAALHNLKSVEVAFPLRALSCVAGVSGSGKSSLLLQTLAPALAASLSGALDEALRTKLCLRSLDYSPGFSRVVAASHVAPVTTPLSFVATYIGLFTPLREFFAALPLARMRGLTAASFSLTRGACAACHGAGVEFDGLAYRPCPACRGQRFAAEILQVRHKGLSIADVLELPGEEALSNIGFIKGCRELLETLLRFHLGYLPLGQPLPSVSSGELQRLQLVRELTKKRSDTVYLFEEPTSGLDEQEAAALLGIFRELTAAGNTVLVVEHRPSFIAGADYIVELGPGAGMHGGAIVAGGDPERIRASATPTGAALRTYLGTPGAAATAPRNRA